MSGVLLLGVDECLVAVVELAELVEFWYVAGPEPMEFAPDRDEADDEDEADDSVEDATNSVDFIFFLLISHLLIFTESMMAYFTNEVRCEG